MSIKHTMPVQIRFSDVDQLGHVNNSVYFSLYDLGKTAYFRDVLGEELDFGGICTVVANVNASFFTPVYFHDNLAIETTTMQIGNKSFTLLQRAVDVTTQEVKCECRTVMVCFDMRSKQTVPVPQEWRDAINTYEGKEL